MFLSRSRPPLSLSVTDTTDGGAEVATLALADDDDNSSLLQTALTAPLIVVSHNGFVVAAALTTGIISTDDVLTGGNPTDSQLFDTGGVASSASGFDLTDGPPTTRVSSSDSKAQFALRFRSR
jgi:hypothetical protein